MWNENECTAEGRAQHQRVHTARVERRGAQIFLYEQPVFSRTLGVSGLCDCVEARPSPEGVQLPYGTERYRLYPIEYKHGVVRDEEEYHIPICAQAIWLEERYGTHIPLGAIFFIDAHRRDEIPLSPELRGKTLQTAQALQELVAEETLPPASYGAKCKKCSMQDYCQPKLKRTANSYCRTLWETALQEGSQ